MIAGEVDITIGICNETRRWAMEIAVAAEGVAGGAPPAMAWKWYLLPERNG